MASYRLLCYVRFRLQLRPLYEFETFWEQYILSTQLPYNRRDTRDDSRSTYLLGIVDICRIWFNDTKLRGVFGFRKASEQHFLA